MWVKIYRVSIKCSPDYKHINVCNQEKTLSSPCIVNVTSLVVFYNKNWCRWWRFSGYCCFSLEAVPHYEKVFITVAQQCWYCALRSIVTFQARSKFSHCILRFYMFGLRERTRNKCLTLRLLMSYIYIYIYIYGAPILDVSRSHTTTQHSR